MRERPICIVVLLAVGVMTVIHFLCPPQKELYYDGEEKEITCVIDSISGLGDDRSFIMRDVSDGEMLFCGKVKVYQGEQPGNSVFGEPDGMADARVGNRYRLKGKLYSFEPAANPGQFDEYQYYHARGISYRFLLQSGEKTSDSCQWLSHWLYQIRNVLFCQFQRCLPKEEGGLLAAMILGEKSGLDKEIKELYRSAGMSHILAISGLHISIIGMGLFFLLRRFFLPMKQAALLCGGILLLYGELTGFPVATRRAVIMTLCVLGARFFGRRYDVYCALALSALIQILIHPSELFQAGFLLSYSTVFGIAFFVGKFQGDNRKKVFLYALKGSIGVQLVTLPLILYFYYEINPYSVFVNLLALPLSGILIAMAIAGGCTAVVWLPAGKFLFGIVHYILQFFEQLCLLARRLPGSGLISGKPAVWQIILYYSILFVWCFFHNQDRAVKNVGSHKKTKRFWLRSPWLICAAALIFFIPLPAASPLTITNLDVGQGDCTCICLADTTMLIDGGSSDSRNVGEYRIAPFLKSQGISRIDKIFITHPDSDHINGLLEIIQDKRHMGFQIGAVVLPGLDREDEACLDLAKICKDSKVRLEYFNRGDVIRVDGMVLQCLHPARDYEWKSANDYSLVLSLEYGTFRGIFTGDLEQDGEKACMDEVTKSQYLKVGHHGSKSSSSEEFLSRIRPDIAVISAGKGNRYGHPAKEVMERLKKAGSERLLTMNGGAIKVGTDGKSVRVEKYLKKER